MKNIYLVSAILFFAQIVFASHPIGSCDGGRGVPYTLAASGGACSLPSVGIPAANVNEAFFDSGAKCGACYEVTGPLGVRTVQIRDNCDSATGTDTCSGDKTQFGIDEDTVFDVIANRSTTDIIYDLGFREVTCDVSGNVQFEATSTSSVEYYFSLLVWNYRVALTEVRVKGDGWSGYNSLTRQGSSAIWSWNKADDSLVFPITLYLVGTTSELLTITVESFTEGATVDAGTQFADVVATNDTCPMAASPTVVYDDAVGYGWDTSNTFNRAYIDLNDTTDVYAGTYSLSVGLATYGGLLFTRVGGFNALYFSYLTFAAKATSSVSLKIYIGDGTSLYYTTTISTEWTVYNISVSALTSDEIVYNLAFLNLNSEQADLYFDSISWELSSTSPLDNVTVASSGTTGGIEFSTTAGIVLVDTTGTTGFSFSEEATTTGSDATSDAASLVAASVVASALAFLSALL